MGELTAATHQVAGPENREPLQMLFVTSGLYGAGAEIALLNLCKELRRIDDRIEILVICLLYGADNEVAEEMRRAGIEVIGTPLAWVKWNSWGSFFREWSVVMKITPHVIQGWMYHGNVAAWLLRNMLYPGTRLMGSVHCLWTQPKFVGWKLRVTRLLNLLGVLLDFDHTFFAGQLSMFQHIQAGYSNARGSALPNGVSVSSAGNSSAVSVPGRPVLPTVAYVSRRHLDKDNENMLSAISILDERQVACHVVLLGLGLDDDFLDQALPGAKDHKFVSVTARGFVRNVREITRSADVVCLSSRSEAFPVSLIEGLAEGAVCVATDVGDCAGIIGECGTVVPPSRPDLLATALESWMQESWRNRDYWAQKCRERAVSNFSIEAMHQKYLRFADCRIPVRII